MLDCFYIFKVTFTVFLGFFSFTVFIFSTFAFFIFLSIIFSHIFNRKKDGKSFKERVACMFKG